MCLYTAMFLSLDYLTAVTVTIEIYAHAHRDTGCRPMHHCNCIHKSPFPVYNSPSTSERHHWTTPHCTVFPGPAPPTPDVALPTSNVAPPLSATQPTTASRCVQLQQLDTFLFSIYRILIYYSCNHTSRESNGPMLRVKIQTFQPNPGPLQ